MSEHSEDFLDGYNQGYQDAEEDFASGELIKELNKEQLEIEFLKGKEEGVKQCEGCLRQILSDYSNIEPTDDEHKALLVRNQILAIKYALDYITTKKDNLDFTRMPWL